MEFLTTLSDGDKSFWGNVVGALIGTMGAVFVAFIAVWLDRAQQRKRDERMSLRRYNSNTILVETSLNEMIPVLLRAEHLLERVASQKPGNFMMNLPRPINMREINIGDLRNQQLVNEWLTLTLRIRTYNNLVEDLQKSYSEIRDSVFDMLRRSEQKNINQARVIDEHKDVTVFGGQVKIVAHNLLSDAQKMLAITRVHGAIGQDETRRFKSPKELDVFVADKKEVRKLLAQIEKEFDPRTVLAEPT